MHKIRLHDGGVPLSYERVCRNMVVQHRHHPLTGARVVVSCVAVHDADEAVSHEQSSSAIF